jgi:Ni/Co efflux regulator RcnB
MKLRVITGVLSLTFAVGLALPTPVAAAPSNGDVGIHQIQYDRDRDQDQRRDDYNGRDSRPGQKWRPGEVIPARFLNRVVNDWEERGLSRPPGGHQWVRVGEQFILVRGRDRMIARILNFD